MRYLLIDRIERLETGARIVAIKNVSLSEDVFTYHFVGSPVMPGALLVESMAQAGTALLELSCDVRKKALLVMVERAKFRALVRPGDQLRIAVSVISREDELVRADATMQVQDRLVADARLVFAMRDVDEFYPPRVRDAIATVYDVWLRDAEVIPGSTGSEDSR